MEELLTYNRVNLVCYCGMVKPITSLMMCRYCSQLRCKKCVTHEVDSVYCPNCFGTSSKMDISTTNRCSNCYECPCCSSTMITKVSHAVEIDENDPTIKTTKKNYYLYCSYCRWTTREAGIEDQKIASQEWIDPEKGKHDGRLEDLMEYYRLLGIYDKHVYMKDKERQIEREKRKLDKSVDRKSLSTPSRRILRTSFGSASKPEPSKPSHVAQSIAVKCAGKFDESLFHEPLSLSDVSSVTQRHTNPETQPTKISKLFPVGKRLLCKKCFRCRQCDHILYRSDVLATSIKFKLQLGALYYVPEVRMIKQIELESGQTTVLPLMIINPTPHNMKIELLPYDPQNVWADQVIDEEMESLNVCSIIPAAAAEKHPGPKLTSAPIPTAAIDLPLGSFTVDAKDATSEYDDADDQTMYDEEEERIIQWRKANKVGLDVFVTPRENVDYATVGIMVQYDYTTTVATLGTLKTTTLKVPVLLSVGSVNTAKQKTDS